MTIKQRALLDILKLTLFAALVGSAVTLAQLYLGAEVVYGTLAIVAVLYFGKMAYDTRVSQLEYEQERIQRALKEGR